MLVRKLIIQLIPKIKSVGTRPIGFFQAFLRLFGRILSGATKQWDAAKGSDGCWSMSAGRSPVDAVWRQSFKAELAANSLRKVLILLWDLKEAYEHVQHDTLMEEGRRIVFPLPGLRAAVTMYRVPRIVILDGCAAEELCPTQGIVAGSSTACHEIKAVMAPSVHQAVAEMQAGPSRVRRRAKGPVVEQGAEGDTLLHIHVDDIAMEAIADTAEECVALLARWARK